jgi:hypothetical protein
MATTNQQIVNALNALCPGAQWVLRGDSISDLQWLDTVQAQPTSARITAEIAAQTNGPAVLIAYATSKQQKIAVGGISVSVGTAQAPINVEASTDPASLVLLQGAFTMAQANANATFNWVASSGPITLTAAQITTIFAAVTAFLQSTFTTLAAVIAAINAGTITTTVQVDSFTSPAWPTNS